MSMITGMYITFSLLAGFAMTMAWWSFRQRCQEERQQEIEKDNKSFSYEADDGPLTEEQHQALRDFVEKNHPISGKLRKSGSLLKDL